MVSDQRERSSIALTGRCRQLGYPIPHFAATHTCPPFNLSDDMSLEVVRLERSCGDWDES